MHGQGWVAGNPDLEYVVRDEEARQRMGTRWAGLRTWKEAEFEIASFYERYIREMHPAKDKHGEPHYDFLAELLGAEHGGKPQMVSLYWCVK